MRTLRDSYDEYPRIEQEFQAALDESLSPRGPEVLYDIISGLELPVEARAIDLGCGEGRHSVQMADRCGLTVLGVDPVPRHIELCNQRVANTPHRSKTRFELGRAEAIPADAHGADLVLCREMIYYVDLDKTFVECRRVLSPGGHLIIYNVFATARIEPHELGHTPEPHRVEDVARRSGFRIEQALDLGSEFGEYADEHTGHGGRQLIHAARLLRDPERYIARFGRNNYDIMLGDAFWHVHRLIGKLSNRIYVLRAPP